MKDWGGLAIAALAAIVACSSFEEGESPTVPPDRDAGGDTGPGDPCENRVLFVSQANGNDANGGCSQGDAIKTVSAALALAAARMREGFEIRICGGDYPEPNIRMAMPISLRGGFNCNTWTRGAENITRFVDSGYPTQPVTLTITGAAIGRESVVDGITIVTPSGGAPATAVLIEAGAGPTLANLQILGGSSDVADASALVASTGIEIRGAGSPEIGGTRIKMAPAVSAGGVGALGLLVHDGASVDLHDSVIEMENGSGTIGTIGAQLVDVPKSRIVRTRFSYSGTATRGSAEGAYGLFASGGEVEIAESYFRGVLAGCGDAAACKTGAVIASSNAKLAVHRTAIYAGDIATTGAPQTPLTYGIYLGPGVDATITSSVIHAGAVASDLETQASGIEIVSTSATRIAGNTVLATGANVLSRAAVRIVPKANGPGTGNNVVRGNIFVGRDEGPGTESALLLTSCGGTQLTELTMNAFVNQPTTLVDVTGASCATGISQFKTGIADLEQHLKGLGSTASGNRLLRQGNCSECLTTCGSPTECAQKVFSAWDQAAGGLSNIESPQGLRLSATVPCAVGKGAPILTDDALEDFFGAKRTDPFAIGYHEIETCEP